MEKFHSRIKASDELLLFTELTEVLLRNSNNGVHTRMLHDAFLRHDWRFVRDYRFAYSSDDLLDDLISARQIQAFISKNVSRNFNTGDDPEATAYRSFLQSEEQCRMTNIRFYFGASAHADVEPVLYLVRRKIAKILGRLPSFDSLDCSFGPGVNTSTTVDNCNHRIKLSSSLECSKNAWAGLGQWRNSFDRWAESHSRDRYGLRVITAPARLAFVPKNAKTHRSICVEPIINGFVQKGIGKYLRNRLLRFGLDLTTQVPNQEAARIGSITGEFATVDLSAASDTISSGLILDLLPREWFDFLDTWRSPTVDYRKGDTTHHITLEKFSSMGNAFTFELESMVFYTIALSVCEYLKLSTSRVRSYGDDIIVPTVAVPLLSSVLAHCGFSINFEKSYSSGPFRESCGADFFFGQNIRPVYLTEALAFSDLFRMYNFFMRNALPSCAKVVLGFIPASLQLWGPDGYGDGHLVGDWLPVRPRSVRRSGWEGGYFSTWRMRPAENANAFHNDYLYPSYTAYRRSQMEDPTDGSTVRGTKGSEKISVYTLASGVFARFQESGWIPRGKA